MRLFVTGASGHIGSAVVPDLLAAGHRVVGLARSDASATALTAAGVEVRRGSLDDLDGLREAAPDADAVRASKRMFCRAARASIQRTPSSSRRE